jgi:hypothetical protein
MAEVHEDVPLVDGDACCREEAAVFGPHDEGNEHTTRMRVEWVEMGWLMVGSSARNVIAGLPM